MKFVRLVPLAVEVVVVACVAIQGCSSPSQPLGEAAGALHQADTVDDGGTVGEDAGEDTSDAEVVALSDDEPVDAGDASEPADDGDAAGDGDSADDGDTADPEASATDASDGSTCRVLVLAASRSDGPAPLWSDAQQALSPPMTFHLPGVIPVTIGAAGTGHVTLIAELATSDAAAITCDYSAGIGEYVLASCSNGARADDTWRARAVALHVDEADASHPAHRTGVELRLSEGCDDADSAAPSAPATADGSVAITCTAASCDDHDACNGIEQCTPSGTCVPGPSPVIDTSNPCVVGTCDQSSGVVYARATSGTACADNANRCAGTAACDGEGACVRSPAPVVPPATACAIYACDPATGGIVATNAAAGAACGDSSSACLGSSACDGNGACVRGPAPPVDDGNPCTADACDSALGVTHTPVPTGTECADNSDRCAGAMRCTRAAVCERGAAPILDDANPCTADACDPQTGVSHTPIAHCTIIPPDPATQATPLNASTPTDFVHATSFLYTGTNPAQKGLSTGALDARRLSVARGVIRARATTGTAPLSGVTVSVLNHPELGTTVSRADGAFDLALNGGGAVTLHFEKFGYLPVQRTFDTGWREYAHAEEVVLSEYDGATNPITLNAPGPAFQVARSNTVTDADGTRRASLFFAPATQALMTMPDGSLKELTGTVTVRATEYTNGEAGRSSVPGTMPNASAYTYAVALTVDEAVLAGATNIQFSKPVAIYVENFAKFPAGASVPTGYYDFQKGAWVPSPNGAVVQILSVASGLAVLDTNGDGKADDAATLATAGITDDERAQLGVLYPSGQALWRSAVSHFTPFDLNWPWDLPPTAQSPDGDPDGGGPKPNDPDPCKRSGSVIGCESQSLGESIDLPGTGHRLVYGSDRVLGRTDAWTLTIPVTGPKASTLLQMVRAVVEIKIAGRSFTQVFFADPHTPPVPNLDKQGVLATNLTTTFTWDGKDTYGRLVQGAQPVQVDTSYVYQAVYVGAGNAKNSFGMAGHGAALSVLNTGPSLRPLISVKKTWRGKVGGMHAEALALGGWSLSNHHVYDPLDHVLYYGDGNRRSVGSITPVIQTIAGSTRGYSGDGGPAASAKLAAPGALAVAPDGTLYVADRNNFRVRKITPDGVISTFAGTGKIGQTGDGGPATQAALGSVSALAIGPDGSVYIGLDTRRFDVPLVDQRVRRVTPDGIIQTVAGSGPTASLPGTGDGGAATAARLDAVSSVAVGRDGTLYVAESYRLRRVGHDGIINSIAGRDTARFDPTWNAAMLTYIWRPEGLVVDAHDNIFVASEGQTDDNYIRAFRPNGKIDYLAGTSRPGVAPDGSVAATSSVEGARSLALARDGTLYFIEQASQRIRRIGSNGKITTLAGNGLRGGWTESTPALQAGFLLLAGLAIGVDGTVYIADADSDRIARIRPGLPQESLAEVAVPSESGNLIYTFDLDGRHLRTNDALSGAQVAAFEYDTLGRVAGFRDADNLATSIARDTTGALTDIVGPYGLHNKVEVDANGYVASVTDAAAERIKLTYWPGGLLHTYTDARNAVHTFAYDDAGRLVSDASPSGSSKTLARSVNGASRDVSVSTALGRTTTYRLETLGDGSIKRTVTLPTGLASSSVRAPNGTTKTMFPTGVVATVAEATDPQFKLLAPALSGTIQLPSGLALTQSETRTITPSDPTLPLTQWTSAFTTNGKTTRSVYDSASRTMTTTTPMGRTRAVTVDARGHATHIASAGLLPVDMVYDTSGRLSTLTQGTRSFVVTYDPKGWIETLTDPLNHVTSIQARDAVGRIRKLVKTDGSGILFDHDENGNVQQITPPGRAAHGFGWSPGDWLTSYTAPAVDFTGPTITNYAYDHDDQFLGITAPDDAKLTYGYDAAGRVGTVTTGANATTLAYDPATGHLRSATTSDGNALTYAFDGMLLTDLQWSGAIAGAVHFAYNANFAVASETVDGANPIAFSNDDDGLPIQAGAIVFKRYPNTRLLNTATLGGVTDTLVYSGYGELSSYAAQSQSKPLWSIVNQTRDAFGRVVDQNETIDGATRAVHYDYDLAGHLMAVTADGAQLATYTYSANGNLASVTTPVRTIVPQYDAQDRLTAYGDRSYSYSTSGQRISKTDAGLTTYSYDALGNLRHVALPSGRAIDYVIDAANRRIGKRVDGALAQAFLYRNDLKPIAELDASGAVLSRFVYGSRATIPDYMVRGGVTYRIESDQRGSPRIVVDVASGQVVQRIDYDAFGNVLVDTNPGFQPFGFAGGLFDRDTGLVRMGARDYDPVIGAFTAKDPRLFAGGDTNVYAYAAGDPVNLVDPSGRLLDQAAVDAAEAALEAHAATGAGAAEVATGGGELAAVVGAGETGAGLTAGGVGVAGAGGALVVGGLGVGLGAFYLESTAPNPPADEGAEEGGAPVASFKKLSEGEIRRLKAAGIDIHGLKGGKGAARLDLYKDPCGNVYAFRKNREEDGEGDPLGINMNQLEDDDYGD